MLPCSPQTTALLLALAAALRTVSGVPLSDWHDGIATNYGGAQDGMNPYDPSFGTKDVRSSLMAVHWLSCCKRRDAGLLRFWVPADACAPKCRFTGLLMVCRRAMPL